MEDDLKWKMTSKDETNLTLILKVVISKERLVGSYTYLKLKLM